MMAALAEIEDGTGRVAGAEKAKIKLTLARKTSQIRHSLPKSI